MNIVSLNAENILRLEAVSIQADGKNVILSGKNGSGKTSVMRCIEIALGGKGMMAEKTIREGQKEGSIEIDLGDIKAVCRVYIAKSGQEERTIKLVSKEGASFPSPQAMLDKLVGQLTFDPLAFSRLDPLKQSETLRRLVGLDFKEIDREAKEAYDQRTVLNREINQKESLVQSLPHYDSVPDEEQSVEDIIKRLRVAEEHNRKRADLEKMATLTDGIATAKAECLQSLQQQIAHTRRVLEELEAQIKPLETEIAIANENANTACAAFDAFKPISVDDFLGQIANLQETNRKVRANATRKATATEAQALVKKADGLTDKLEKLGIEKKELLESAKFPVAGLSFTESGVVYNSLPFEQASAGEQLRVSAAIGMALNPKLKILMIRDASLLDDEAMAVLAAQAHEKGYQLWLERVGTGKEVSVLIEEGGAK